MYDHTKQYRCTIIRGKSQKEIDDFLPTYTKIIMDICPCSKRDFDILFNDLLNKYFSNSAKKKTLDNHRTEIAGKLFGMYYAVKATEGEELTIYPSERTMKFSEDNDQPAFFKDVCFKMQFPNGMTKLESIKERIDLKISIRTNSYLIKTLIIAKNAGVLLSKDDIGYYILNSLNALTRVTTPLEIIEQIELDKKEKVIRKIHTDGKAISYDKQHINEQLNYLELANLIIIDDEDFIRLNENELATLTIFAEKWNDLPMFDVTKYDFNNELSKKQLYLNWGYYFSTLSDSAGEFTTTTASLGIQSVVAPEKRKDTLSKIELGDEGEFYVYEYEKNRVKEFDSRLAGKVIHLGKTRGLGYDIQSVIAESGDMAEFVKYIEVKSTKRVTEPDLESDLWIDTVNITRNEWVAAQQHKDFYSIYRVYFIRGSVIIYVMTNLYQKEKDGIVKVVPLTYRVDFKSNAIDNIIKEESKGVINA